MMTSLCIASTVIEDADGTLWFGGLNGISKLQPSKQYYYLLKPNSSLPSSSHFQNIISLHQQNNGKLWLGTDAGLYSFEMDNSPCKNFAMEDSGFNSYIFSIAEADSVLWLATLSGIKFFDLRKQAFIRKNGLPVELMKENENIAFIFATVEGDIWINDNTNKALYKYNKATERWNKYQHNADDSHSISTEVIGNILEDNNGNTWFCTLQDGLMRYDKKNDRFDFLKTGHTLLSYLFYIHLLL